MIPSLIYNFTHSLIHSFTPDCLLASFDCSQVLFSAYAPLVVPKGSRFPLSIWAYLRQQRAEMQERATRRGDVVKGESSEDFTVGVLDH